MISIPSPQQRQFRRILYYAALFLATAGLSFLALAIPFSVLSDNAPLRPGDVATTDIRATKDLTYASALLTEEMRNQVVAEVEPVYSPIDTTIARRQLERLRVAISYISAVRADAYAIPEQKLADLGLMEDIHLEREVNLGILELSNSRWQTVQQEAIVVLEQLMRNTIRENDLEQTRGKIPTIISLSLSEDQAKIVARLVSVFVIPNSLYDEDATQLARQQARSAVVPVLRTFVVGETIIDRGNVISTHDMEALEQFGLTQRQFRWEDMAGAAALVVVTMTLGLVYLRHNPFLTEKKRRITVLAALFGVVLFSGRIIIPGHTVIPYLFPLAAYSLTTAVLFGAETALVTSLPLALMVTYGLAYSMELSLYYIVTSLLGIFVLGKARRFTSFFWTGMAVAVAGFATVIAYRLSDPNMDLTGVATLLVAALIYGVASAGLTLVLQFFLSQILGMTTALQLMELSRPDHPLLRLLLRHAPGTYQHSLQVANLVEQAAESIDADALLTRIGALYHDIGKIADSIFFIENQLPGNLNPHDDVDPEISAAMVIRHVAKGIELARKYRLPRPVQDFITEHHGTMLTHYQYGRALKEAGGDESLVDQEEFRYPGPKPQSRETALLMLGDGCEAQVRAEHPKDENELRILIRKVVEKRLVLGQLNETDLTLRDLENIIDSFTTTLRGIYHPRIQYPALEKMPATKELPAAEAETPALPVEAASLKAPDPSVVQGTSTNRI